MIEDLKNNLKNKRITVICPKYFGYEEKIVNRLNELGAEIFYIDERPSNSLFAKICIRLFPYLYVIITDLYYQKKIEKIEKFDIMLVINPETLSLKILNTIKKKSITAKYILYMWDSFSNKKRAKKLIAFFDKILTFDPDDAREMNIIFRPLFFCSGRSSSCEKIIKIDISFVGTGHSDRAEIISSIRNQCEKLKLKYFLYLYLQTVLIYYYNRITNSHFKNIAKKAFHYFPLDYNEYEGILESSKAVIDIEHPEQKGLTMRTFEILGKETKLITTNKRIKEYDFYNDSNILVIDRANPCIVNEFFDKDFQPLSTHQYYKYSIDGWLEDILFKCYVEDKNADFKPKHFL
jgi:hypothetical protein